ncbi:MAG TPA: ABC transporter substrate-binding protein [Stellaceae bacterium]|nr:ABC transporter substrate-binding protein [Stellaceae bacterium]
MRKTCITVTRGIGLAFVLALLAAPARAEEIKVGMLKSIAGGPLYLARERGYFAAENLAAEIAFFDSSQPIALAVMSRDVTFGATGFSGGFYALAAQGALRIVSGASREVPGFNFSAYVVSNKAWEAGLRSYKDFPGHSFGISQVGSPPHYALALLSEKYRFDLKSVRLLPLQSISNIVSALVGGQADAGALLGAAVLPVIAKGQVKLLGWSGDETPWQLGAIFVSTKTATENPMLIERFLRAYVKGVHDYHDAFTGPDERRTDGAQAEAVAGIIARYTGLTPERVKQGIVYVDREARIDVKDVLHQAEWYRSQGLVKSPVDPDQLIDRRFVKPLPTG